MLICLIVTATICVGSEPIRLQLFGVISSCEGGHIGCVAWLVVFSGVVWRLAGLCRIEVMGGWMWRVVLISVIWWNIASQRLTLKF